MKKVWTGIVLVSFMGCREPHRSVDASAGDPPAVCTAIGVNCTLSPGKLGTCVEVEPTTGPTTLVCQSQH
jgi:hypothetical protein